MVKNKGNKSPAASGPAEAVAAGVDDNVQWEQRLRDLEEKMRRKYEAILSDIRGQMAALKSTAKEKKAAATSGADFDKIAQEVYNSVQMDLETGLDDMKKDIKAIRDELAESSRAITSELQLMKEEMDSMQQYSRRNCLVLRGVEEKSGENTDAVVLDVLHNKLRLTHITLDHIERTHRLGKPSSPSNPRDKPRGIIMRFVSYRPRREVFTAKKALKGSDLVLTEHLTALRHKLLRDAMEQYGKRKVWTLDGRIFAEVNGNIKLIKM